MICFGYTFPFWFLCDRDYKSWPITKLQVKGVSVDVFPPFKSGDNNQRACPQYDFSASPSINLRGIKTDKTALQIALRPDFVFQQDPSQTRTDAANSFTIEVHTDSEDRAKARVDEIFSNGLRALRRQSGQFWIGKFPPYFESFLQVSYKVDKRYQLVEEPWSYSSIYTPGRRTREISRQIWFQSWTHSQHERVLDEWDLLMNAEHLAASGEIVEAYLQAALSFDKARYSIWNRLLDDGICTRSQHKSALNDTSAPTRYIGNELTALTGQGFEKAHPGEYEELERLWRIRGIIAHAKEDRLDKLFPGTLTNEGIVAVINAIDTLIGFGKLVGRET